MATGSSSSPSTVLLRVADLEKQRMKQQLFQHHLYGIDAAEMIARIAQLNMYLHGDGGSTIYTADALDNQVSPPTGRGDELRSESDELRRCLVDDGLRFDTILTNPP